MASSSSIGPSASEETDIYVFLNKHMRQNQDCDIFTFTNQDSTIDRAKGETTPFFEKSKTIQIRIPAIMCFRHSSTTINPEPMKIELQNYLQEQYRQQVGTHVYFSCPIRYNMALLRVGHSFENDNLKYCAERSNSNICSIYPCYRSVPPPTTPLKNLNKEPQKFQIVLGLCFFPNQGVGRERTWGRYCQVDDKNNWSFDVTSKIFKPGMERQRIANYAKPDSFPVIRPGDAAQGEQWSIAFYVCQGARVVLIDHRQLNVTKDGKKDHQEDKKPGVEYEHCRSLCQQGSVIIVRGICKFGIGLRDEVETKKTEEKSEEKKEKSKGKETRFWRQLVKHDYNDFFTSDYIRPNTSNALDEYERDKDAARVEIGENQYQDLFQLKDKVIFLGAVESQFNSACWEINIKKDDEHNVDHLVQVVAADGAMIVDIAPWIVGFQLIYSRQRYERLHESVIRNFAANDNDTNMEFQLPEEEYLVKRMIGIRNDDRKNAGIRDGWYNTFQVVVPSRSRGEERRWKEGYRLERDDQDIRRYIPLRPECQENLQMRNIEIHSQAPSKFAHYPLYPPYQQFSHSNDLLYLSDKEKVVSVADDEDKFGEYFKIVSNATDPTVKPDQLFKLYVENIGDYDWQLGNITTREYPGMFMTKYRMGIDYQKQGRPVLPTEKPNERLKSFYLMPTVMEKKTKEKAKRKERSEESGQEQKKQKKDSGGSGSGHKSSHTSGHKSGEKHRSSSESEKKKKSGK